MVIRPSKARVFKSCLVTVIVHFWPASRDPVHFDPAANGSAVGEVDGKSAARGTGSASGIRIRARRVISASRTGEWEPSRGYQAFARSTTENHLVRGDRSPTCPWRKDRSETCPHEQPVRAGC